MPSPFSGVDPFLESQGLWLEFHSKFINCWQELLLEWLPPQYDARLDERIYLADVTEGEVRLILPDVTVEKRSEGYSRSPSASAATREPATVPLLVEEEARQPYVRILHRENQELVTVLEVLSPANKRSPGLDEYRQKRASILKQPTHLVELDLLLGGTRLPTLDPLPRGHFYAVVSREETRPHAQVYSWTIRDALPAIPIPLKAPDPDCLSDLGESFGWPFSGAGTSARLTTPARTACAWPVTSYRGPLRLRGNGKAKRSEGLSGQAHWPSLRTTTLIMMTAKSAGT